MIILLHIPDETAQTIAENCGDKTLPQMISNLVWQASRDTIMLTRARDMVDHQPWAEYDNTTYE